MTHNEIIGFWELCSELITDYNLVCERYMERFKLYDEKGNLLFVCEDVNELHAFLMGLTYPKKYVITVE
jgi:hypothetical protein